jgi:predicted hydrocarbon binding protein
MVMKGIIFNLLENLIVDKFGDEILEEIYAAAHFSVDAPPFVGPETYPDSDLFAMVTLLSKKTNLPVDDLVYEFGKYMFPVLADTYPVFLDNVNSPLEFLKSVNDIIHVEVKKLFEGANAPIIKVEDVNHKQAKLRYSSERKLCKLVEGLLDGVADYFGQKISYSHQQCMRDGARECILHIQFYD